MRFQTVLKLLVLSLTVFPSLEAQSPPGGCEIVSIGLIGVGRGHELSFKRANDANAALHKYGEYEYDNLVLFAPTTEEFGDALDVQSILDFIDSGRNVFMAGSSGFSDPVMEIAKECGLELDDAANMAMDHLHFDAKDNGDHTLIVTDNVIDAPIIVGEKKIPAVVYRGVGMALGDNPLVLPLLTGSSSSYTYNTQKAMTDNPIAMGKSTVLVAALQARNNARVVVSGSLEFFSDEFFLHGVKSSSGVSGQAGNEIFSIEVAKWAFQERGMLHASNVVYKKADSSELMPPSVRIKDELSYSVDIHEWNGKSWVPYSAKDVQVEFVMLDPYERVTLSNNGKGTFSGSFVAPDVYGIFQFVVAYARPGYSAVDQRHQISVLPFRHNEFERFIVAAYPYYASAFSMMAAFVLFGFLFMFSREGKAKSE